MQTTRPACRDRQLCETRQQERSLRLTAAALPKRRSYRNCIEPLESRVLMSGLVANTAPASPDTPLTGTILGTAGSYQNDGNTIAKAFDGNASTFFDAPTAGTTASPNWVGLDLGSAYTIAAIEYAPRINFESRMIGGMFQVSNNATFSTSNGGVVDTLSTITSAPPDGYTTINIPTSTFPGGYEYARYLSPSGAYGNIAELDFFGSGSPAGILNSLPTEDPSGASPLPFTIKWSDDVAVSASSLGGQNLLVTNSNIGYSQLATLVSTGLGNGPNVTATYTIPAPNGGWGVEGQFTITVQPKQIQDTLGNYALAGYLGTFEVLTGLQGPTTGVPTNINNDSYDVGENSTLNVAAPGLFANDEVFGPQELYPELGSLHTQGSLLLPGDGTGVSDGSFQYTPPTNFVGVDTFNYFDQSTAGDTPDATVTLYVLPAPTGTITSAPPLTTVGNSAYSFTVTWSDETAVSAASLGNQNLLVTNSSGYSELATLLTTGLVNGSSVAVTYSVPAPSGGWSASSNGTYTIAVQANQVQDTLKSFALAENVGTFSVNIPGTAAALSGTLIGTSGSYQNDGNTAAKAFDGNTSTFFDAPTADGNWVGLDLGSAYTITSINYAPRVGFESRMVGGEFQVSNNASFSTADGGVVDTLYTITSSPPDGYTTLTLPAASSPGAFRYVRYLSPSGSYGNIAELQFFGTAALAPSQLTGTVIGTSGSYNNDGNTAAHAFDGNTSTFFDAPTAGTTANPNWVGLDLGSAYTITSINYAPRVGFESRMVGGEFQVSNNASFSTADGGVVDTLYTITAPPSDGYTTLTIPAAGSPGAFRFIRYLSPTGSYGNVADLEVYGA